MNNFPEYDDVGSFPLPENIDKKAFAQFYWTAYKALLNKANIFDHKGIYNYFINPMLQSLQYKLNAGVEIINYPQHMDIYTQFLQPITDYETSASLIDPAKAIIPEVSVIEKFAKEQYEKTNKILKLKVCVTGPVELYVKKNSFTVYLDLAMNFAKSINAFLKNSYVNTKYLEIGVVSVDEPSFGYVDLVNVSDDDLAAIFEKTLEGIKSANQIHLHTLSRASVPLQAKNVQTLTCEYATDPTNKIPKKDLEQNDKFIRVGITRTNINRIIADALDEGASLESVQSIEGISHLIDPKERIKKNLLEAIRLYGDRLKYIGPDCGLGGWATQKSAQLLLERTVRAVKGR